MDFEYVRNRTFELVNCNNVTVDGCGFRHFTRTNAVAGSNNIFRNNDVYDGAAGGIGVSGGDINSLNGGQKLICLLYTSYHNKECRYQLHTRRSL